MVPPVSTHQTTPGGNMVLMGCSTSYAWLGDNPSRASSGWLLIIGVTACSTRIWTTFCWFERWKWQNSLNCLQNFPIHPFSAHGELAAVFPTWHPLSWAACHTLTDFPPPSDHRTELQPYLLTQADKKFFKVLSAWFLSTVVIVRKLVASCTIVMALTPKRLEMSMRSNETLALKSWPLLSLPVVVGRGCVMGVVALHAWHFASACLTWLWPNRTWFDLMMMLNLSHLGWPNKWWCKLSCSEDNFWGNFCALRCKCQCVYQMVVVFWVRKNAQKLFDNVLWIRHLCCFLNRNVKSCFTLFSGCEVPNWGIEMCLCLQWTCEWNVPWQNRLSRTRVHNDENGVHWIFVWQSGLKMWRMGLLHQPNWELVDSTWLGRDWRKQHRKKLYAQWYAVSHMILPLLRALAFIMGNKLWLLQWVQHK